MSEPAGGAGMRWASTVSMRLGTREAATEAAEAIAERMGEGPIDLLLAFFTAPHVPAAATLAEVLRARLAPRTLAGASGFAVISAEHEIETGAALTLVAARMPGVEVAPFVVMNETWPGVLTDPRDFEMAAPGAAGAELVVLLADPFSLDLERVLAGFNRHASGVRLVGGLASAGGRPRSNVLLLNDWVAQEGGVAIALKGALRVDVIVSQGCRPVGPPLEVTKAAQNILIELDGVPALERAEQVLQELPPAEKERLEHGLYVGRPVSSGAEGRGAYLLRTLLGADRERGLIAIGDMVRERERVRFHVRDAETATEDLEMLLSPQPFDSRAHGALLFACNGRGTGLYGRPDGDIQPLQESLGGGVPIAGMFCAGEVGPVGGTNFLHGHTASIAVVRPA